MTRLLLPVLMLLLLAGCAHKPGAGSYADAASTYAALSSGSFTEANPIIATGDPLTTALASLGVKQGAKYALTYAGVPHCDAHRGVETAGMGAAGWNIALLAGAGPPGAIAAGLLAGYTYYRMTAPEAVFSCTTD